ncbi:plastocyanin/azurin family copper-binding protein [bacterium]|nr:plastocyanin/azurin family copper-binding protein [bacterium]
MTFPFRFAALALTALPLAAITLQVDFDHAGTTQSGWQSIAAGDSALGDSWSKNFTGGVSLDVDAVGGIVLDTRDRAGANGGGGEAAKKGYVPDDQRILHATKMLKQGQSQTLRFLAPTEPGIYPYLCTFPGHWTIMKGELIVE